MSADNVPMTISWFPTAMPNGPAIGDPERTTWGEFCGVFWWRREGDKDGPNFVPARFSLEPDGRHVRRLKRNLIARTAIALDCETSKETREVPPQLDEVVARIKTQSWAAVAYTSHRHTAAAPRYRIVLPLSEEIATDLPAIEVVANDLQLLGALDRSKLGASSLFYLPSAPHGHLDDHDTQVIEGNPLDAEWMRERARIILAQRQAEADQAAEQAHAGAAAKREAKIAEGFDPDDSLIEKIRSRFDLDTVLRSHGYATSGSKSGTKYRHPNSESGGYGADIKVLGGIERIYSHNGTDPLHASNLPAWCGGVTALDVVDVVVILDHGGDRKKALCELAKKFGITKTAERKAIARLLFRMVKHRASQEKIEQAAFAEGHRLGLSRAEVCQVATYVAREAA